MGERKPFADAERFVLEGEDGAAGQTWVVLAIHEVAGTDYALLAPESELEGDQSDMEVVVFQYRRDDDGRSSLHDVADEATYERVYHEFASIMGLEESGGDN